MQNLSLEKTRLHEIRIHLKKAFEEPCSILDLLKTHTQAIDELIIGLWKKLQIDDKPYALMALGGYGRQELYPYSDIDILILSPSSIKTDPKLEIFIQSLWDLKLKVSPLSASIEELIALSHENLYTLTSLIDHRYLSGDLSTFKALEYQKKKLFHLSPSEFFKEKLIEQTERHAHFGTHAFSLEPNLKESPGGLRDLQTLIWSWSYHCLHSDDPLPGLDHFNRISILEKDEMLALEEAYLFLAHIRFALHLSSGKKEDRLFLEWQLLLAPFFVNDSEDPQVLQRKFMKTYYHKVSILSQHLELFKKALEIHLGLIPSEKFYPSSPEIMGVLLNCPDTDTLKKIPLTVLRTWKTKPQALFELSSQQAFLSLLDKKGCVYPVLKTLHLWRFLALYLPEFHHVTGLIQHNSFHSYTVDQHLLYLTAFVDRFYDPSESNHYPLCHELLQTLPEPRLLYLAALFHDIGKGYPGDHSLVGAMLTRDFCQRLNSLLSPDSAETLIWLVANHLLMSTVAQRQDIDDPEIIIAFAKTVGNLQRLKLLYLLTVADISATHPTLWNSWKDSLLKKLYLQSAKALAHDYQLSPIDKKIAHKKQKALVLILEKEEPCTEDQITALWSGWPKLYFLHHNPNSIIKHSLAILKNKTASLQVLCFSHHPKQGHYELFIYCEDQAYLFASICNIIEKENLNVVSADILTTENGLTLDSFYLLGQNLSLEHQKSFLQRLKKALEQLRLEKKPAFFQPRFMKQDKVHHFKTEVYCRNPERQNWSELELITRDRPGILAKMGLIFYQHQINLKQAKIATLGQRVEDLFTISNAEDQALSDTQIESLKHSILSEL